MDVRKRLEDLGWQQGSILPLEPELIAAIELSPFSNLSQLPDPPFWAIVVAQDCIVVGGNFDIEPAAELVLVTPLERVRQTRRQVRHPRELDFTIVDDHGMERAVTLNVRDRAFIDRRLLTKYPPDKSITVSSGSVAEIVEFLAGRYEREPFPNAFEERFAKVKKHWAGAINKYADDLLDIFVVVKPFREIPPEENYSLTVYALLNDAIVDGPRPAFNELKQSLKGALRQPFRQHCEGIDLEKLEVYGRDDITLREFASMKRLDFGVM